MKLHLQKCYLPREGIRSVLYDSMKEQLGGYTVPSRIVWAFSDYRDSEPWDVLSIELETLLYKGICE